MNLAFQHLQMKNISKTLCRGLSYNVPRVNDAALAVCRIYYQKSFLKATILQNFKFLKWTRPSRYSGAAFYPLLYDGPQKPKNYCRTKFWPNIILQNIYYVQEMNLAFQHLQMKNISKTLCRGLSYNVLAKRRLPLTAFSILSE